MVQTTDWRVLSTSTIAGDAVVNGTGEDLGKIEDVMLDVERGRVAYAVLSFGGFMKMGNKLFAVPWDALSLDAENKRFILDMPRERLENAPGFDKDNWPGTADQSFVSDVYRYYETPQYW